MAKLCDRLIRDGWLLAEGRPKDILSPLASRESSRVQTGLERPRRGGLVGVLSLSAWSGLLWRHKRPPGAKTTPST